MCWCRCVGVGVGVVLYLVVLEAKLVVSNKILKRLVMT